MLEIAAVGSKIESHDAGKVEDVEINWCQCMAKISIGSLEVCDWFMLTII